MPTLKPALRILTACSAALALGAAASAQDAEMSDDDMMNDSGMDEALRADSIQPVTSGQRYWSCTLGPTDVSASWSMVTV